MTSTVLATHIGRQLAQQRHDLHRRLPVAFQARLVRQPAVPNLIASTAAIGWRLQQRKRLTKVQER